MQSAALRIALSALLLMACQTHDWPGSLLSDRAVRQAVDAERRCSDPSEEIFYAEGSTGYVERQRCVDSGPDFHYAYDVYAIASEGTTFIARSYAREPTEAHFLRKEVAGRAYEIGAADLATRAFRRAAAYLRERGMSRLRYLSLPDEGYVAVPP